MGGKPKFEEGQDFEEWKRDIKAAADSSPNVYVKLSGFIIEHNPWSKNVFKPAIEYCLQTFGVERCLYGGDWPVCKLANGEVEYGEMFALTKEILEESCGNNKDDLKKIFRENAIEFYNLKNVL